MDYVWNQALKLQQIHVLFVDHDCTHDTSIKEMFASLSCEVSIVRDAFIALLMLSNGDCLFDLVMEKIQSPDAYGIKLLHDATMMDLPVILLTDGNDPLTMMRGMDEGAIFCIEKPVNIESIKYAWQHVLREKLRKLGDTERPKGSTTHCELLNIRLGHDHNNVKHVNVEQSSKSVRTRRKPMYIGESSNVQNQSIRSSRKDSRVEWTPELHEKFASAVKTLGEGRCFPKQILELMNVPNLRRMQVASHLQKCRAGTCIYAKVDLKDPNHNEALIIPSESIPNNIDEHRNAHPSVHTSILGLNSHVHAHREESTGHIPDVNDKLEELGDGDFSVDDMIISNDLLIFNAPSGMNTNTTPNNIISWDELHKELDLDDELFANQVEMPIVQEKSTDHSSHVAFEQRNELP